MAKFGRIVWNNNDFINVFLQFRNLPKSSINEIQIYYQVYHDLCKFRQMYCYIIYKQIIWPNLEEFFWNNNDFINVFFFFFFFFFS